MKYHHFLQVDGSEGDDEGDAFERALYLVRRRFGVELKKRGLKWDDDDGDVSPKDARHDLHIPKHVNLFIIIGICSLPQCTNNCLQGYGTRMHPTSIL